MYTWGEIQIETCKKMFLNSDMISTDDLETLRKNNNYKTYFNGMAQAANEGIEEILKRGKPYIKTFKFTRKTNDNLLGDMLKTINHTNEDLSFESDGVKAYYFEVDNEATINIYVDDELVETIENEISNEGEFTVYKGFVDGHLKLEFTGLHPYNIRNVCMYALDYNYGNENDTSYIPDYTVGRVIDLKNAIKDFYKIIKFYYQGRELVNNTDYRLTDMYTLIMDRMVDGEYIIKYQCYPEKITDETDDEYELPLEYDTAVLLPLYMASELYKDDDISLATIYRNEFEAMVDNTYHIRNDLKFTSKTGWL